MHDIYKVEKYIQKNHKEIDVLTNINDNSIEYFGICLIDKNGSNQRFQFKFPSNVKNISHCFDIFDDVANFQFNESIE